MSNPVEVLTQEVLRLAPEDRARLLDMIVSSLDADPERDARWDALAAQRDAEIETGSEQAIDGAQLLRQLRQELA
jgi:isochorismate hydrolase